MANDPTSLNYKEIETHLIISLLEVRFNRQVNDKTRNYLREEGLIKTQLTRKGEDFILETLKERLK